MVFTQLAATGSRYKSNALEWIQSYLKCSLGEAFMAKLTHHCKSDFAIVKSTMYPQNEHLEHCYTLNLVFFRLSSEYEEDIEAQLFELKNKYDQEKFQLEEALTELEPYVRDLETKNTDLQTKLERQKDEMEKKLKQQKTEMEDLFSRHMQSVEDVEKKKIDMELKYKKQISDLELTFRQERLELESEFEKQTQDVRELQKQKVSLELELKQQRDELELSFRQEKQEIQQLYEERIREETEAQKHLDTEQLQGVSYSSIVNILIKWASTQEYSEENTVKPV